MASSSFSSSSISSSLLMATTTIHDTITKTLTASAIASSSAASKVTPQGGILDGANPTQYDRKNPITLFIIQAGIIIIFCRILHWPLSLLRQPRVIAEVIGGILLGPSVFGRIPHFTQTIFPDAAMPNLNTIANLGLILFLFLVGLEVDVRFLISNWRVAASVGIGGMALPFGLGCAIAWGLYHEFSGEAGTINISFGVFMLFVGVAMAITAFPVLCRILTELKLLSTPVGVIVLSAGVGNDVVGWILLALCVALVNAGTGLTALWVLLTCVGYSLCLAFVIRPGFLWMLNRTRSIQDGPSQSVVALTLLLALTSSFFTGAIGVHPIFGAFMIGLICPHEGGFAIKLTEKIEDLVSALFLPLYFAYSGLSTNLGLLNSGIVWAYVIGITACAFFGKVIGASLAARATGMVWRESLAVGSLMSCKGLVELIVLNIGLQAKILSTRTFTMFVVMALVTTFITTPLTHSLYPPWYQKKLESWKRGEIDWDTGKRLDDSPEEIKTPPSTLALEKLENFKIRRILVYLRFDNMPAILAFMGLIGASPSSPVQSHPAKRVEEDEAAKVSLSRVKSMPKYSITAHGVHLIELTERNSSVMRVTEVDEYAWKDPLINTFRTFGQLNRIPASGEVAIMPINGFADTLINRITDEGADMLFLPWTETDSFGDMEPSSSSAGIQEGDYSKFVLTTLQSAPCNIAVFVNLTLGNAGHERPRLMRSKSGISVRSSGGARELKKPIVMLGDGSGHVFCPIFGGVDDLLAISVVLQMIGRSGTATILRFEDPLAVRGDDGEDYDDIKAPAVIESSTVITAAAAGDGATANTTLPRDVHHDLALFESLKAGLPAEILQRVVFETVVLGQDGDAVKACLERATTEMEASKIQNGGDMVVLGRNLNLKGMNTSSSRNGDGATNEVERCLGVVGAAVVNSGIKGGVLVVKAAT